MSSLSRHTGEVAPSYGDGGGKRHGRPLRFQIMICNSQIIRLGPSPSVADYRATSPAAPQKALRRGKVTFTR